MKDQRGSKKILVRNFLSEKLRLKRQREPRGGKDVLHDAVAQTGDDHQHPGQSPLHRREHLGKHHRPLDCGRTHCSVLSLRSASRHAEKAPPCLHLTRQAFVSEALELAVVDGFLQHAQEDDSSDPELDPEQIPPVARRQSQPQHRQQHIHDAHDHVELETEG